MTFWREAGLSYLKFSTIAAATVRKAIKSDKQADIAQRSQSFIKNITKKTPLSAL